MNWKFPLSVVLTTCALGVWAADEVVYPPHLAQLKNCRFDHGAEVPQDECDAMRKNWAQKMAKEAADKAYAVKVSELFDARKWEEDKAREAEKLLQVAEVRKRQAAEQSMHLTEMRKRQADEDAQERAEEARERKAVGAMKSACGDDYKNPRIGMSIARAKQCVTSSLRVSGQINRADGVVTTYTSSSGAHFHVMKGQIVAWTR